MINGAIIIIPQQQNLTEEHLAWNNYHGLIVVSILLLAIVISSVYMIGESIRNRHLKPKYVLKRTKNPYRRYKRVYLK